MKRTVAEALVLVNWRGIFYERFLLDQHVTALEGVNGAGKTTVMIGAYVVLLPDMTRLRFTNVGETSAIGGDKGIYGRLGEPGRPSYTVLDLRLASGERFLAGVHLERRAEPSVELTPFVITGLTGETSLQEVLLDRGELDSVPDLNRLRELVTLAGARLKSFASAKEYFGELFDQGVTPLRLSVDEERAKLNEMLRTSMVGGISKALTGGMREFLLKEETGLADTLKRMRANLDACRRTRMQVEDARRLEGEIHSVYEAGQQMFAAALHATRERADESHARMEDARGELRKAREHRDLLAATLTEARARHNHARELLGVARHAADEANAWHGRVVQAHAVHTRIRERERQREEQVVERDAKAELHKTAEAAWKAAGREREVARESENAAARGLAEKQAGFAELERRAALHRLAVTHLEAARGGLPGEVVTRENAGEVRARCATRAGQLNQAQNRIEREVATAEARLQEFLETCSALERIAEAPVEPTNALERARFILAELRRADDLVSGQEELQLRLNEARSQAERQQEIRRQAAALESAAQPLTTMEAVRRAFDQEDEAWSATKTQVQREKQGAEAAQRFLEAAGQRVRGLEELRQHWRLVRGRADALGRSYECFVSNRADLDRLRRELQERRDKGREERRSAEAEWQRAHEEEAKLGLSGGGFDEQLLRARDLVEGELFAGRFEELPVEEAGQVQAMLGPLHEAILVADVHRAAEVLASFENSPDNVWLIGGDSALELDANGRPSGELMGSSVLVGSIGARRLTRVPAHPVLGRKARERRSEVLRRQQKALDARLELLGAELKATDAALEQVADLLQVVPVLERGDPADELEQVRAGMATAGATKDRHEEAMRLAADAAQVHERRRQALKELLGQAHLLDAADYSRLTLELSARLEEARAAGARLRRVADDRLLLESRLDVLRELPPSGEELVTLRSELTKLVLERERLAGVLRSLHFVEENYTAFDWTDAEPALRDQDNVLGGLDEQLRRARDTFQLAERRLKDAEVAARAAADEHQRAQNRVNAVDEALNLDHEALRDTGVADPSDEALASAQRQYVELKQSVELLDGEERALGGEVIRREEGLKGAEEALDRAARAAEKEERDWKPLQERWERLRERAEARGALASAFTDMSRAAFPPGKGSVNLWQEAKGHAGQMIERIKKAQDGASLVEEVDQFLPSGEQFSGEGCLDAWLLVRNWLRRRVPPQIAEVDEPLEALGRLRVHLTLLQERLAVHERNLRGQSNDVAHNIETQIRKASRQVSRLNQELEGIRFGSIQGVQIRVRRNESMERVLRALREEEAQFLLFQSSMPIEQAMEELFRRHAGERAAGHRLLDYREYVDLQVEVRRLASTNWEAANPTKLSTGEAIGVGAAVMMVVLTAWERDANLLREKRSSGTLRFLFLDEANRLSRNNLATLFELCQNLELQLLVAAPEVAHADGNTTYRLVRRAGEHEQEEVLASGRRTRSEGRS